MAARIVTGIALALWMGVGATARADDAAFDRLVAAYPEALAGHDGTMLFWKDGTRTPLAEGPADKPFDEKLRAASLADQMSLPYAIGPLTEPPGGNMDPGRFRNIAFFDKVYGDCKAGGFEKRLVTVRWLPKSSGKTLRVNTANGAAKALEAISAEIELLPADLRKYAHPSAGTFNCRVVKDTGVKSAHAYGIAIDLNTEYADYWLWAKGPKGRAAPYRNRMPQEIVDIFERHGYIWGGKWGHFDTMHFEYRPELLPMGAVAGVPLPAAVKGAAVDVEVPAPVAGPARGNAPTPPGRAGAPSPSARPGVAADCAGRQPGLLGCGVGFGSMSERKIDP